MAKKADFKDALNGVIEDKREEDLIVADPVAQGEETDTPFILEKKKKTKVSKKSFPVYMDEGMVNDLDKVCNKTGYTRNELINKMVAHSLKNLQIK